MKPSQLKRILVPVDFSAVSLQALDQAIFIARLFKADIYALHVIEVAPTVYSIENPALPGIDVTAIEKAMTKKFDDISTATRSEFGIKLKTTVTHGRIAREILSMVEEQNIDLVVMGTHGVSGFDEYFIGSNAHKVTSVCPVPVITVQRKSKKVGYGDILLPIDNTMHSREKMNFVMILAKKFGSVIHILGLPDDDDPLHLKQFGIKIASVEKIIKKAGLAFTTKIAKGGDLAEQALRYSKKVKADLIATMNDGESHYGLDVGPFAKQLINHSAIPVLSIKPTEGSFEGLDMGGAYKP